MHKHTRRLILILLLAAPSLAQAAPALTATVRKSSTNVATINTTVTQWRYDGKNMTLTYDGKQETVARQFVYAWKYNAAVMTVDYFQDPIFKSTFN